MTPSQAARLEELLCDRATDGLSEADEVELTALLQLPGAERVADEIDACAAELNAALIEPNEPLPQDLHDRIRADAASLFEKAAAGPRPVLTPPASIATKSGAARSAQTPALAWLGWVTAAAALVALLLRPGQAPPPPTPTVAERFALFAAEAPDLVRLPFAGQVSTFNDVKGEVLWSDTRQAGFMRLEGLPANDPLALQYQLWVVDPQRDKHPVDGGVFNVTVQRGEAIVPFNPVLPVHQPTVFAITAEKPGGVVVSAGPLLVVATQSEPQP